MTKAAPKDIAATFFAAAERASRTEVEEVRKQVLLDTTLTSLIDAIPDYALVLNQERQVVAANRHLLDAFGLGIASIIGKRPGETFGCIFSSEGPAGCGTGNHCSVCGAVMSILESQETLIQNCHECHISLNRNDITSMDLEVCSTPATVNGIPVTVCVMRDISDQKRRSVLERVFFHDVINTVGGIHGIAAMLMEHPDLPPEKELEYKEWMVLLSNRLIDEINHQRKLLDAERGEFRPDLGMVRVPDLVREVHALYVTHDIAAGRHLVMGEIADCSIESDGQILHRILGNLVKNALEATPQEGTVTLSCSEDAERVTFAVTNPGVMPAEVQLQIFQRSFSTKAGSGRGIGTYSVKLFGERYLKGKVAFTSREPEGTSFTLSVPKHFN
ncbi:PAS/PAC sensor signal transduction histidine kinase [Geobacter metallireducens RCH3]|uniref:Sensor histidine kinase, nonconserved putative heme-binding site n=1 Tax=Geobacter metallireducens (strain ATCC 53774 / DSM 7210 / GS-15) TaxID=269799 RepID=Q39TB2_GEOMG|nr:MULTISPECIES: HAMP domain-containing sensor histidine kinase [Geobacter]ABB32512.1 sensor histidine kinase, nonconserved putative heme-binding site [Geobacter metallireducens GS-15]EHP84365.1 PAS/PAC sensor signal transduction histidine kinase [Geobacter metallireducens RCH3]MBT1076043.1 HAMP domain-containing histidine kinase [Geobacter grbiciae]